MQKSEIETIEVDLLLEAIFRRYGHDFRSYARASIERRIKSFLSQVNRESVSGVIRDVLYNRDFFYRLARSFSVTVTEMFRDPFVYKAVRDKVIPLLKTWPHIKVWDAGCATGEEAYSLAILLKEEGLYDRATLYATDFNGDSLATAKEGVYNIDRIQEATRNYYQSGGRLSLSEYYHARYNAVMMDRALKERIVFASHNLASDNVFGETHLIFCRNVMIYFNKDLQNRALNLFAESLVNGGFLCIGTKEDLRFSEVNSRFAVVDDKARIYKKRAAMP